DSTDPSHPLVRYRRENQRQPNHHAWVIFDHFRTYLDNRPRGRGATPDAVGPVAPLLPTLTPNGLRKLTNAVSSVGSRPQGQNPGPPATLSRSPRLCGVDAPFVKNLAVFGGICGGWLFVVRQRDGEVARIL